MKNIFKHFSKRLSSKKLPFIPYEKDVRVKYFSYSGLFWFLGLLVAVFSFFVIINFILNNNFHITSNIKDINFTLTPIFNLILVLASWILLLLAPKKSYKSPKHSSIMFYFSFWFLVVAVVLSAQLQVSYIEEYGSSAIYHWVNFALAKVVAILSVFALFGVQIFFWIMRRKFAFMPTDYDIYTQRSIAKQEKKALKLQKKQNAKLANKK